MNEYKRVFQHFYIVEVTEPDRVFVGSLAGQNNGQECPFSSTEVASFSGRGLLFFSETEVLTLAVVSVFTVLAEEVFPKKVWVERFGFWVDRESFQSHVGGNLQGTGVFDCFGS